MGPSQLNENLFSIDESVTIRTLPQYSDYHDLYYNDLLKDINSGELLENDSIIEMKKEYRVLCKN